MQNNVFGSSCKVPTSLSSLCIVVALSAFGGCSGGGASGVDQSKIGAFSAESIGISALIIMERTLQLAAAPSEIISGVEADDLNPSSSSTCVNGGSADYQFTDVDQNDAVSGGDTLRASYRDCLTASFQDPISGSVSFDIADRIALADIGGFTLSGTVTADDLRIYNGETVQFIMNGEMSFTSAFELLGSEVSASSSGTLSFRDPVIDVSDNLSDFEFRKIGRHDEARYEVSAMGELESGQRRATYRYKAGEALSGVYDTFPDLGSLVIEGAESTAVNLNSNFVVNSDSVQVEFQSPDELKEVSIQPWNEHITSFLWAYDYRLPSRTIVESGASRFLNIIGRFPRSRLFVNQRAVIQSGSPLTFQFDAPIDATRVPSNFFLQQTAPSGATIALQTEVQGALLILRSQTPFISGAQLQGPLHDSGPNLVFTSLDGSRAGNQQLSLLLRVE